VYALVSLVVSAASLFALTMRALHFVFSATRRCCPAAISTPIHVHKIAFLLLLVPYTTAIAAQIMLSFTLDARTSSQGYSVGVITSLFADNGYSSPKDQV